MQTSLSANDPKQTYGQRYECCLRLICAQGSRPRRRLPSFAPSLVRQVGPIEPEFLAGAANVSRIEVLTRAP